MIATSVLTGRIYSGAVNKSNSAFIGNKKDVTSEVLKAIIDKAEFHGGNFEIEGGGKKWTVIVEPTPEIVASHPDPDQYNQVAHMIKRGYSTTFVRDAVQQLPDGEYILYVRDDTMPKIA